MYGSTPWDDTDFDQLETIPHTNPHRLIDPLMNAADKVRLVYSINQTVAHPWAAGEPPLGMTNFPGRVASLTLIPPPSVRAGPHNYQRDQGKSTSMLV